MITVWGRNTSSNVQLVTWTLGELGIAFDRKDVGGAFGGLDTPAFLAMNPNGTIPVLQDGETTIFESHAIVRYLAAKHGDDSFWPVDPARRSRIDMWMEWSKTTMVPVVNGGIFWTLVRTPSAERDPAKLSASIAAAGRLLSFLENRLGDDGYLMGDDLTAADIGCGHILYRYFTLPFERPDLPRLAAYYDRLTQRPAYAEHAMVSYAPLQID